MVFLVSLVFLVSVLCSSVPLQPSPNKRAQAPADSIEFPMGSKETLARNWSFHFSQVNYITLFIFVVDRDLSRNSCLTHATTVLSETLTPKPYTPNPKPNGPPQDEGGLRTNARPSSESAAHGKGRPQPHPIADSCEDPRAAGLLLRNLSYTVRLLYFLSLSAYAKLLYDI